MDERELIGAFAGEHVGRSRELQKNGNPPAQFDVNKRTEFRVTIMARTESGQINPESGQIKCGTINGVDGRNTSPGNGMEKRKERGPRESGTIKWHDNGGAKSYDTGSQDSAVLQVVEEHPGIKRDKIFLEVKTSLRSVQRTLERLEAADKIEYRGSKRTGGWFVKT